MIEFRNRLFQVCCMTMISTGSINLKELQEIVCKHFKCDVEDYKSIFGVFNKMQSYRESLEYRFSGKKNFKLYYNYILQYSSLLYFIYNIYKYVYNQAAELRLRDDDNELGYVAIGLEGSSYKQREDHIALTVAKEIIGSWDKTCSKQKSYI